MEVKTPNFYKIPGTTKYEIYVELEEPEFNRLRQLSFETSIDLEELAQHIVKRALV
jgi:hypothetical protein